MTATERSRTNDRQIVIEREFNTSREKLWDAWTKDEHIEKWFGPEGFTTTVAENDFSVGGRSRYIMTGPDGTEYPSAGVYKEIVRPERIVTTDEFGEGIEEVMPAADLPEGMILTVIFRDLGERSGVRIEIDHPSAQDRQKHEDMGVVAGWQSSFDCLDKYLSGSRMESGENG